MELGQGILTALAQIAAEELDLPLASVAMISGDTAQTPDEEYTSGSQSIEYGGTAIRLACAEGRALLLERAAARFGIPGERVTIAEGIIRAPDGRSLGYGELAAELDLHREVTAKVAPKPPSTHRVVGTSGQYGLTEVKVGIPFPSAAMAVVQREIGPAIFPRRQRVELRGHLQETGPIGFRGMFGEPARGQARDLQEES